MSLWLLGSKWEHTCSICEAVLFCGSSLAHLGFIVLLFVLFFSFWLMKPAAVCYHCRFSWIPISICAQDFLRAFRGFYMEKLIVMSVHFPVSWLSLFTMCLVSFPSACFQFGCWLNSSQLLGCLLFGGCLALLFPFATFVLLPSWCFYLTSCCQTTSLRRVMELLSFTFNKFDLYFLVVAVVCVYYYHWKSILLCDNIFLHDTGVFTMHGKVFSFTCVFHIPELRAPSFLTPLIKYK